MSTNETEKFLDAEKTAQEIVEQLKDLNEQAGSYKDASYELGEVRQDLEKLARLLEDLGGKTLELIQNTNEMGVGKIHSLLSSLADDGKYHLDKTESLQGMTEEAVESLKKMEEKMENLERSLNEQINHLTETKETLSKKVEANADQAAEIIKKQEELSMGCKRDADFAKKMFLALIVLNLALGGVVYYLR
jgi:DNA repair exonuclease SbcCD ATPase subunit